MADKVKIEVKLKPKIVKQLEIISNAFNMSMNQFIEQNIEKDLNFVLRYVEEKGFHELEDYYGVPFVNKETIINLLEGY